MITALPDPATLDPDIKMHVTNIGIQDITRISEARMWLGKLAFFWILLKRLSRGSKIRITGIKAVGSGKQWILIDYKKVKMCLKDRKIRTEQLVDAEKFLQRDDELLKAEEEMHTAISDFQTNHTWI